MFRKLCRDWVPWLSVPILIGIAAWPGVLAAGETARLVVALWCAALLVLNSFALTFLLGSRKTLGDLLRTALAGLNAFVCMWLVLGLGPSVLGEAP